MRILKVLRSVKKTNLLIFIAMFYIGIILIFGVIYWEIANLTSGEFFVFQEDVNMNIKMNAFKKQTGIKAYNKDFKNVINDLMIAGEYKRPFVKILKNEKLYTFDFSNSLGDMWANYYYLLAQEKGITHMKIESAREDMVAAKFKTYVIKISLYKLNGKNKNGIYEIYKNDSNNLMKIDTVEMWVENYPLLCEEFFNDKNCFYPLNFYFVNLIKNSVSFLDDSPIVLKKIANDKFKYSLWNFLYFSTVTITTLGYGDILPNSTLVRVLVMVETISGVFVVGTFGSCLFWNKKK
ncbi:two pore domain potassium channel family protein [Clostridium sp. P21]|uniref:Two pore domain potassium channel family protein n=1 Tax=Clostridium muellerianum TaxID=2716538 RepID=A0A7Y0EJZ0_9CLOT|nr:potassium channel family protein [Clostridium muellerianum]NMM64871.1 two pore domain potassium channel family protein [Clostridium muellerianum]